MQVEHLTVGGMTCGGCVSRVTAALKTMTGIGEVEVVLATGRVDVSYDERQVMPAEIKSAIEKSGYGVVPTPIDSHPRAAAK